MRATQCIHDLCAHCIGVHVDPPVSPPAFITPQICTTGSAIHEETAAVDAAATGPAVAAAAAAAVAANAPAAN